MGEMLQWSQGTYGFARSRGPEELLRACDLAISAATLLFRLPAKDIYQLLGGDGLRRVPQHVHHVSYVVVAKTNASRLGGVPRRHRSSMYGAARARAHSRTRITREW